MARFMNLFGEKERQRKLYLDRDDILGRYSDVDLYRRFRFDRAGIEVCLPVK